MERTLIIIKPDAVQRGLTGKIRFVGQSCHVPDRHRERIEADEVDFIFHPYNYMALAK